MESEIEKFSVLDPGEWDTMLDGWWAVCDEKRIIAYFREKEDANAFCIYKNKNI